LSLYPSDQPKGIGGGKKKEPSLSKEGKEGGGNRKGGTKVKGAISWPFSK